MYRGCEIEDRSMEQMLTHCPALAEIRAAMLGAMTADAGPLIQIILNIGWLAGR